MMGERIVRWRIARKCEAETEARKPRGAPLTGWPKGIGRRALNRLVGNLSLTLRANDGAALTAEGPAAMRHLTIY